MGQEWELMAHSTTPFPFPPAAPSLGSKATTLATTCGSVPGCRAIDRSPSANSAESTTVVQIPNQRGPVCSGGRALDDAPAQTRKLA